MTRKGGRKSQSQDELAKKLFTETKTEDEATPQKATPQKATPQKATPQKSDTKKTPKSAKKRKFDRGSDTENMGEQTKGANQEVNIQSLEVTPGAKPTARPANKTPKSTKKTQKTKTPSKTGGKKDDEEVTFNFEARSAKKPVNPDSSASVKSAEQSAKKVRLAAGGEDKTDSGMTQPIDVVMETTPTAEPDDVAMETKETVAKVPLSERNLVKRPTAITGQSKKRKLFKHKKEVSASKKDKTDSDSIFFYCGNLPPGVTQETLMFFFEEEGIHPKIVLNTVKKWDIKNTMPKLTPKERGHKKNIMKAARSRFATIIVKNEGEAKKLLDLQGVAMPAPIRNDWSTNLKIVRRLPRLENLPYKVHIGGLHKDVDEDELKTYLELKGVKPGKVVVIRRHKTSESKRYGFIWFETVKDADKAVDLPEPTIREKPVKIQHSFKKKFKNF